MRPGKINFIGSRPRPSPPALDLFPSDKLRVLITWIRRSGTAHAPGKISPRMSRLCLGLVPEMFSHCLGDVSVLFWCCFADVSGMAR